MAEAAPASVGVGTMLAGTYKVTGLLGRGGMGSVWVAEHSRLPGKKVAIKVLHRDVAADEESLARFRREAEIATRLGHPNIVEVHDFNLLEDGTPYLVLELLPGEDLAGRLRSGAIPLDETCSIVRQIGSALATAHRENIVHRDLKPQNIFLCPTESGGFAGFEAKVLDFGISKIRGSQTVKTNAATMLGTPQYMAPEQALGNHAAVDERTDIFALGAMVYEMLSGRPAFLGQSIPEVVFKVVYEEPPRLDTLVPLPPGVVDAVHKALAKKQEERFPDVQSFVEALTGSPLHTVRRGAVVAPGDGSSPGAPTQPPQVRSQEAYADTVGSAPRPVEPALAARPVDPALAATVDSSRKPVEAALAATMHSGKTEAVIEEPPRRRSRRGMWFALTMGGVGAAAVIGFVSLRGGGGGDAGGDDQMAAMDSSRDDHRAGDRPVGVGPRPQPVKTPVTAPMPVDAGMPVVKDPEKPKPEKPRPVRPEQPKPEVPDTGDSDAPKGSKLNEWLDVINKAEGALRAGEAERAIAEANRSLVLQKTARGYAIKAQAYCLKHDLGMAKATVFNVKGPRLRKRVASFCARQGLELD